jgi:predicted nucleic-acid-binding protein
VAVVELAWVLTGCYGSTKVELCASMKTLLRARGNVVAHADTVWKALRVFKDGKADFADCLIEQFGNQAGCNQTTPFDRDAAGNCGMWLLA